MTVKHKNQWNFNDSTHIFPDVEATDSQLQIEEMRLESTTAHHLKIVINSGHNHFVSVHRVHVDGTAVHK
jgi:hypothetical protein